MGNRLTMKKEKLLVHKLERKEMLKMDLGAYYLPKQGQGEDAYFVCTEEQTIGVADGVGGWAKLGVDAGIYARELMKNSKMSAKNQQQQGGKIDPRKVLNEAYTRTKNIKLGSSTACIVTLKHGVVAATLHAVNIGDSGFMLFTNNKLTYQSSPQCKSFNCPYQLGSSSSSISPNSATEMIIDMWPGGDRVIVVGTDGLLDNVFPHEIEQILNLHQCKNITPQKLAKIIGELASSKSEDEHNDTPFAREAKKFRKYKNGTIGGKRDDITVVVGIIKQVDSKISSEEVQAVTADENKVVVNELDRIKVIEHMGWVTRYWKKIFC